MGLAALCFGLVCATGCATTTFVTVDDAPSVSPAVAKRDLGIDYLSSGRTAMALRQLVASLELDPSDPKTHLWLGESYRRKGQVEVAEEFFLEALELASERGGDIRTKHEAQLNLSALLSQVGRYEDSLAFCEALASDPMLSTPWRPLTNCGWALMKLGRFEEARAHFRDALDYFPNYGPALLNLGVLDAKQGHNLAAIRNFERALDRLNASGRAEANFRLGEIFMAMGRRDRAIEHFSAAVKIAPDLDWGSQSQAYLDLLR
jgi:type IV pilus assembly protein PilF